MTSWSREIACTCLVVLSAAALTGCGTERSPEAYCEVMDKHKQRYVTAMDHALGTASSGEGMDLLAGGAEAFSALSDLKQMWTELSEVAPEEIRVDVEAMAEAQEEQAELAKSMLDNPMAALGSALWTGFSISGPAMRVDEYTKQHCS